MMNRIIALLKGGVSRRLRQFGLDAGALAFAVLTGCVAIGFATFAAYELIRQTQGRVAAALIVGAAWGLVSIATWISIVSRSRTAPRRNAASAGSTPSDAGLAPVLQAMAAAETPQVRDALGAAIHFGRSLSPAESLALAFAAGLLVGRRRGE